MADWNELKRLAEAATPGPWVSCESEESELEGWVMTDDQKWSICATHTGVEGLECHDENAAFIAAANPAAILALIAENERLQAEVAEQRRFKGEARAAAADAEAAALGSFIQIDSLRAERDQLRAEVEALRGMLRELREHPWCRVNDVCDLSKRIDAALGKGEQA